MEEANCFGGTRSCLHGTRGLAGHFSLLEITVTAQCCFLNTRWNLGDVGVCGAEPPSDKRRLVGVCCQTNFRHIFRQAKCRRSTSCRRGWNSLRLRVFSLFVAGHGEFVAKDFGDVTRGGAHHRQIIWGKPPSVCKLRESRPMLVYLQDRGRQRGETSRRRSEAPIAQLRNKVRSGYQPTLPNIDHCCLSMFVTTCYAGVCLLTVNHLISTMVTHGGLSLPLHRHQCQPSFAMFSHQLPHSSMIEASVTIIEPWFHHRLTIL